MALADRWLDEEILWQSETVRAIGGVVFMAALVGISVLYVGMGYQVLQGDAAFERNEFWILVFIVFGAVGAPFYYLFRYRRSLLKVQGAAAGG